MTSQSNKLNAQGHPYRRVQAISEALLQDEFKRWRKRYKTDAAAALEGFKSARGLHMRLQETQARLENALAETTIKPMQALKVSLSEMLVVVATIAPDLYKQLPEVKEDLLEKSVTMFKRDQPGPDQNPETFVPGIYFVPNDGVQDGAYCASS